MTLTPNDHLRSLAQSYNRRRGYAPVVEGHYVPADCGYGVRTAEAYDRMPGYQPEAEAAYAQFADEVDAQYAYLLAAGYVMTPTLDDPYGPDSAAMFAAVRTRTVGVLKATEDAHALLPADLNTRFRFVHDLFGHAAEGYQFGPRGEFNAALHHAQMFSPLARQALLTETHGQNSWFNHGPQPGTFAPQKAAVLPERIRAQFATSLSAL